MVLRLALFPLGRNFYADGVMRAELGAAWAAHPHFIADAGQIYEIGPLHVYLTGLGALCCGKELGSRLPSLVFSLLLLWPLWRLARRLGPLPAPALALAAAATYALLLQGSGGAASEPIFVTLFLVCLEATLSLLEEPRLRHALLGGGALLLCCATRYEAWMYAGLLCLWVGLSAVACRLPQRPRRLLLGLGAADRLPPWAAAVYIALGLAFPLFWMAQNALHLGDPLWTFARHAAYHRAFAQQMLAAQGRLVFTLRSLLFWPLALLLELTPGVAVLGAWGAARALRRPLWRGLLLIAATPPVLLSLRAAVLGDLGLISRFTVFAGVLLTAFVGLGWEAARHTWARRLLVPGVLLWLGMPLATALCSHGRSGWWAERLRQLSPIADLPPAVEAAAGWLRRRPGPVLVDSEGGFAGMAVAFYSGLPEESLLRVGWDGWRERLRRTPPPCAVLFDDGVVGQAVGAGQAQRVVLAPGLPELTQVAAAVARPGGVSARMYCE